jgi:intracellular septation protein A
MKNLMYALRPLASDFLSTIVFVVLVALHVDLRIATASAIAVGLAQVAIMMALKKPVALLQWAGLGLVVVLGTVSIVTNDPRFVMVKPTIIYLAIAVVMLKRGWMLRYMPPIARGHGEAIQIRFGYVWAGLMALTAVANLVVAVYFTRFWPAFFAVVPTASKLALFAIQYLTVRHFVKRKVIAQMALDRAQAALPA